MKTNSNLAVALFAGCAIGAAAITALHAQTTLPAYSIVEVNVIDAKGFKAFAQRNAGGSHRQPSSSEARAGGWCGAAALYPSAGCPDVGWL